MDLYLVLDIAQYEIDIDYDVLIASCLLHDIGRQEQFENPSLCHALIGGDKAYSFLISSGYDPTKAEHIRDCIRTHRFRSKNPPQSIKAKILFDSDKIDATGAIGIARTIFYAGLVSEPLYSLLDGGQVSDSSKDAMPSFFQEYKFKLEKLYDKFYNKRADKIALERQEAAVVFYRNMLSEVHDSYAVGLSLLDLKV